MVIKKRKELATIEQVQEIVDRKKDPWQVQILIWIFRGAIFLTLWKSIQYIYLNGFNENTLAGLGLGISTTIIILLIVNVIKGWFKNFIDKFKKNLNNSGDSN